jgi:hypothetical protein
MKCTIAALGMLHCDIITIIIANNNVDDNAYRWIIDE